MSGENWILVAMSDDALVADALLRLRHSEPPPPPPEKSDASPLNLKWSVRQRRLKKGEQTRSSPTTPLSWSGGGGSGGGANTVEGLEESSGAVKRSEAFRSKTLAELKEEEIMLLKESKGLKNELASMRNLVEQETML